MHLNPPPTQKESLPAIAAAAPLPLNTRLSCAEPLRSKVFVDMAVNADSPMEVTNWLLNRQMPTRKRSAMASGIMVAAAMERDASLDTNKGVGKMLLACLDCRLIVSMNPSKREDLNL